MKICYTSGKSRQSTCRFFYSEHIFLNYLPFFLNFFGNFFLRGFKLGPEDSEYIRFVQIRPSQRRGYKGQTKQTPFDNYRSRSSLLLVFMLWLSIFFQYGLSPTLVGVVFLIGPGVYAIIAPFFGYLADKVLYCPSPTHISAPLSEFSNLVFFKAIYLIKIELFYSHIFCIIYLHYSVNL